MKFKSILFLIILLTPLFFNGCSKKVEEYNKSAMYWYSQIISAVSDSDLDAADRYYASLQGEHIASPLLPEATLILSIAHMENEEYLLSEHFSNEYVNRYANLNEREFAAFMKIKAKYQALPNPRRDQVLIQDAINEGGVFKRKYPDSMYIPVIDTMLTNLKMAEAVLNESIANLYMRLDKPRSADYYRNKKAQHWIEWENINRANSAWYKTMFEGDGTQSWYGFLIPNTQSVVSRRALKEEYIPQGTKEETRVIKPIPAFTQVMADKMYVPYFVALDIVQKTPVQELQLKTAQTLLEDGVLEIEEFNTIKDEILGNKNNEIK